MPQIVVTANENRGGHGAGEPPLEVLRERIAISDLDSDQFAAHLLERIGWALSDADTIETRDGVRAGSPERPL